MFNTTSPHHQNQPTIAEEEEEQQFLLQQRRNDHWLVQQWKSVSHHIPSKSEVMPHVKAAWPLVAQGAVSVIGFSTGLSTAQFAGALFNISSASNPLLSNAIGFAGVSFASLLSVQCSRTCERLQNGASWREALDARRPIKDMAMDVFLGTGVFLLLGGRFHKIMPSDLWQPGSLASVHRGSIKASGQGYATTYQRGVLQGMYEKYGCHHCGSKVGDVIADHIPPNKFVRDMGSKAVAQRFFPQCRECMHHQAQSVRNGIREIRLHNLTHLPKVTAGILMGLLASKEQQSSEDSKKSEGMQSSSPPLQPFRFLRASISEIKETGVWGYANSIISPLRLGWLARSHTEGQQSSTGASHQIIWARAKAEYRLRLAQLKNLSGKLQNQGHELRKKLRERGISQSERERVKDSIAAMQHLKHGYDVQMQRLRKRLDRADA